MTGPLSLYLSLFSPLLTKSNFKILFEEVLMLGIINTSPTILSAQEFAKQLQREEVEARRKLKEKQASQEGNEDDAVGATRQVHRPFP